MGATGSWSGVGGGPSLSSVDQAGSALRVFFDESMTNNAALVNPLYYTITPLAGGDAVTVLGVTPGPGTYPTYVDLTLSNPTTSGSSYQLAVDASLEDAAGNAMDAGGLTLTFLGFGGAVTIKDLGDLGIIEALTGVFGEEMAEVGGWRMTRLAAAVTEGDTTFQVETTLDWPEEGIFAVDGVRYTYSSKGATSFAGIEHVAAGATVSGAVTDHRDESAVTDLSREYSALDLLRRGFLVNYAEGEDLNALGRNLGVNRPPIFSDDDQFRAVIKAVAYNPRGTVLGLELALEALVGAGNYEVYEDLIQNPNTVFIRVDTSTFLETTAAGRAFLGTFDFDDLGGTQDELVLGETPLGVGSVQLYPMDHLFDFRDDIPSDVDLEPWPGETDIQPWTYAGTETEGSAVLNVAGSHTRFLSPTPGTAYYTMSAADGARLTSDSDYELTAVVTVPTGATLAATPKFIFSADDRTKLVNMALLDSGAGSTFRVALYGAAVLGSTVDVARDIYHELTVRRCGSWIELWVDGALVTRVASSSFGASSGTSLFLFGVSSAQAGLEVRVKQLGVQHSTVTDYWNAVGAAGAVATANPTQFDDTGSVLAAGDVGKQLRISGGTVASGINNGTWLIDSYVSPGVVELIGPTREDAAVVSTGPDTVTVEDEEAFTYPDDIGKTIVISGSALGNDGSYTITALIEAGTGTDYSTYDTPITGAKTNIARVSGAPPFTPEPDLEYRLDPAFQTEAGLDWELSDAGSFAGNTLTLRQGLWVNGLVMEIHYSNVYSAQLLADADVENTVGVGPTYDYWPFYLADPFGLVQAYMDDLTAAGVIPEFEAL